MFTGIVEAVGKIAHIEDGDEFRKIRVVGPDWLREINTGSSLAINGCCTTSIQSTDYGFTCELMKVTLTKTSLGSLNLGSEVNLERPLKFGAELGGHLMQGHVDAVAAVKSVNQDGENRLYEFELPIDLMRYVVHTGSISIDGVSLTASDVLSSSVVVGIIPHTFINTVFRNYKVGDYVNVEVDMIGKFIEKLLPEKFRVGALK